MNTGMGIRKIGQKAKPLRLGHRVVGRSFMTIIASITTMDGLFETS